MDSSDSVKRQESLQPEVPMFGGSDNAEVKDNKPKRRTFEQIREENRRRQQQQQSEELQSYSDKTGMAISSKFEGVLIFFFFFCSLFCIISLTCHSLFN